MLTTFMSRFLQISFFLLLIPVAGFGQIKSNAAYSDTTHYTTVSIKNDKIFVFSDSASAKLIAKTRDTANVSYIYIWTRYIIDSSKFCDTVKIDTSGFAYIEIKDSIDIDSIIRIDTIAIDTSFLSPDKPGCYQVSISGDTILRRAWVFFDKLDFRIDSVQSGCTAFIFRLGNVHLDTVRYFDLLSKNPITLVNRPKTINWKYDDIEKGPDKYSMYSFTANDPPPTDTTTFFATFTNTYNHSVTRTYKCWVPMATRAKFSFLVDGEPIFRIDTIKPSGGAPLNVRILNKSKNGKTFEWYYKAAYTKPTTSDTNCTYPPIPIYDTTYTTVVHWRDLKDTVECKFFSPGKYTIKIVSKNTTCDPDTFTFVSEEALSSGLGYSLEVLKSMDFDPETVPQIFNPNVSNFMFNIVETSSKRDDVKTVQGTTDQIPADKTNLFTSTWTVTKASIRDMKISIFDRWGRIVYQYDGSLETDDDKYWDGWNGKIDNHGTECEPGVYYWVIELKGWDDSYYHDSLIKNKSKKAGGTSGTGSSSSGSTGGSGSSSGTTGSSSSSKTTQSKARKVTQCIHTGFVYLVRG
jgi:uncharacterized membrane protein YgcG